MLPDEARPAATQSIQPLLDEVFDGGAKLDTSTAAHSAPERARDAIRVLVEAERLAVDPTVSRTALAAEVDALLARAHTELTDDAIRRLTVLATAPLDLVPPGAPPSNLIAVHAGIDRDAVSHVDVLGIHRAARRVSEQPTSTRASVAAELEDLLARPRESLTVGDVRRMLVLTSVPEAFSPWAGIDPLTAWSADGLRRSSGIGVTNADLTATTTVATTSAEHELDALQLGLERLRLVESGTTAAATRDELRSLLATATDELTPEQQRRIALLDGLPAEQHGMDGQRFGVAEAWSPSMNARGTQVFQRGVEAIRLQFEAAESAASTTRDDVRSEAIRILARRVVSNEDLRRLGVLAAMPSDIRPPFGESITRHLVDAAVTGTSSTSASPVVDAARSELYHVAAPGFGDVADALRTSDHGADLLQLDPLARQVIADAPLEDLRGVDLSHRRLVADTLETTRGSGSKSEIHEVTAAVLPLVKRLVTATDDPGTERTLVQRLDELLTRNAERAEGVLRDGYSRHPDYAEHGRAIEIAQLLSRIEGLRERTPGVSMRLESAPLTW